MNAVNKKIYEASYHKCKVKNKIAIEMKMHLSVVHCLSLFGNSEEYCNLNIESFCLHMQQQLNTSFDDETAALLNDCYTLEEKERLKEEWRLFEEQKRNFERERNNFTEAAIRLGREVHELF